MSSRTGASQLRFDALQMYHHDPVVSSPDKHEEPKRAPNVVHDARLGRCLVWRPVEGLPLPRRFTMRERPASARPLDSLTATAHGLPSNVEAKKQLSAPCRLCRIKKEDIQPTLTSSTHGTQALATQQTNCHTDTPPRGQLLRRGKGGIDDVLKNAREAQNLFYSLQERRLKAEYRNQQQELKAELDQQRHYKRMLELSAYQEELVHVYGPSMRDIIADVFFDDGHDPVLAFLKAKREAASTQTSLASGLSSEQLAEPTLSRQLWERSEDAAALSQLSPVEADRKRASQEREMLMRALNDKRCGRRTSF